MCLFSLLLKNINIDRKYNQREIRLDMLVTKQEILNSANDEQQEAIKHQEGACMIIAGPGSGR